MSYTIENYLDDIREFEDLDWETYDCPCGCGDCSFCDPNCGDNGERCPEGQCLGEL